MEATLKGTLSSFLQFTALNKCYFKKISKYLTVLHQRETKMAQVLQEASHCFLHWDGGCASSMCVEKLVETAVAKLLGIQVPRKTSLL